MRDLNARARAERILDGETLADREAVLADDGSASVGDEVITRRNDRGLRSPRGGWVRNGDRWQVVDVHRDGAIEVRRADARGGGTVVLPADYVAQHVELGYAVTAYRAQGTTVDTCHVVVAGGTSRENLYVAMTRGRDANTAYVALDRPDDQHAHPVSDQVTALTVLANVLAHSGVELSAHETIVAERERYASIAQIAAEYEAIATLAQRDRWEALVTRALVDGAGLSPAEAAAVVVDDAFGPLCIELRRIDAVRADVEAVLDRITRSRGLEDAENVAAVLTWRLWNAAGRPGAHVEDRLIAGIVPEVRGELDQEIRVALNQRAALIRQRAHNLAEAAVRDRAPWLAAFGPQALDAVGRARWFEQVVVVAAYRDRYRIGSRTSLGGNVTSVAQARDRDRAEAAVRRAQAVVGSPAAVTAPGIALTLR